MKRVYCYLIAEPFTWIFSCLFQPTIFKEEFATKKLSQRGLVMFRLALPMFLCSYLLVPVSLLIFSPNPETFHLSSVGICVLGILCGVLLGIYYDIGWGITAGIGWGLAATNGTNLTDSMILSLSMSIGWATIGQHKALDLTSSMLHNIDVILRAKPILTKMVIRPILVILRGIWYAFCFGMLGVLVGTLVGASVTNRNLPEISLRAGDLVVPTNWDNDILIGFITAGVLGVLVVISEEEGIKKTVVKKTVVDKVNHIMQVVIKVSLWSIFGALLGSVVAIIGDTAIERVLGKGISQTYPKSVITAALITTTLAILYGFVIGIASSTKSRKESQNKISKLINYSEHLKESEWSVVAEGLLWLSGLTVSFVLLEVFVLFIFSIDMKVSYYIAIMFFFYVLSYSRLIFYPIHLFSMICVSLRSKRDPAHAFFYLRMSSFYWDEYILLPLPGLAGGLVMVAQQNLKQALEEITFIISKRPEQITEVRKALIEIVLSDLTKRDSIQSIASASQQLSEILFSGWESTNTAQQLSEILFSVNAKWITVFTLLSDISQEARHYCNLLLVSRRSKNDALSVMEMRLQQVAQISREISSKVVFISKEKALNLLLNNVVAAWQKVVQHEQEMLDTVFSEEGDIPNPYIAGPPLKYGSRLFVGRRDLAPQIEEALSKGNDQPTFLLYGERRMGKSSTLRQLPELLGTRYLPIFFDMQSRGISSSITDFFITVSREIGKAMRPRGMQVKRLDEARLQEASHRNEAAVYLVFDQWFEALERILEQENRTLLLTFDEFEKLEEAGQSGFLDLKLLLDWFRNATQHHPRLALLFSGVHPLEEMGRETGINWAGYLVNVQPLKVSFLYPDEARSLITRPTDDFPSERIFTEDVVDRIIDETHGHPFLVQALCSVLITNLNEKKRKRAEIQDVVTAVQKTLEGWWGGYFHDLWKRSDKNQQTCLHIIGTGGTTDWQSLVQDSGLDERIVSRTIEILLQRDLIVRNEDNRTYRIVAPIFSKWVQREYSITIQESYQGAKQDQSGYSSDMIAEEVILLRRENQALRDKVSWQQEQIDLQQGQMAAQQETISVQQAQLSQQIEQLQQQIRSAFRGDQLSKG